jgi:hypothetical protein
MARYYKQGTKSVESSVEFSMGVSEERTLEREVEESPLLEAVAREQLMKKQQTGKRL